MTLEEYINKINQRFQLGNSTEHTFRGDLQALLESIVPNIAATNEPKRIACGSPDFVITKKEIPIGFIEAKDIGDKDLEGNKKNGNKEQFDRYKNSLDNIAFTDYLDFHFYVEKKFIKSIAIGKIENGKVEPIRENFDSFERHIKDFCIYEGQTITSPKKLAEMIAAKAQFLAEVIEKSLDADEKIEKNSTNQNEDSSLKEQFEAFKQLLIHDITHKNFADVYAQTIAYGMFAARLHDELPTTFTRKKAAELIPKSNPFLRKLFQYIAGFDLDTRLVWIVDSLSDIFVYANVEVILKEYGRQTQTEDALIHFYETFLAEYDPNLRKARGVWYTPKPVVNFIVRAVDEILKTEFDLPKGLVDNSKTIIKVSETINKKNVLIEKEIHKVQILDPATGTGTFLAETVEFIYKQFENQKGSWNSYVENDLLPRLNGFELLMASYAMAHLKLDFLLKETDYKPTSESNNQQRFRIFLTNSLEEGSTELESSFAGWLSNEANEANKIKKNTPVMVVMGNPPYAVSSSNKNNWIQNLIADYKKNLKEKNIQPLSDDYIKFIRFGQHFIDKNESGVLAFITNNSFLDGIIHRQMRKNLLESFDKIYILDLHGNSKKKETAADGSPDKNIFDIMQGVSINIFIKKENNKKEKELAKVFHFDLMGNRESKFDFLQQNSLKSIKWKKLKTLSPNYFFVPKDFEGIKKYSEGFKINELFPVHGMGITTANDAELIEFDKNTLVQRFEVNNIEKILYRLFDIRYINYDLNKVERSRENLMTNFIDNSNLGLLSLKGVRNNLTSKFFITTLITDKSSVSTLDNSYIFPLYIYPQRKRLFRPLTQEKKQELKIRLQQANYHYNQVKNFFNKKVLPFYNSIDADENSAIFFEEHRSSYEEAKAIVEQIQSQLEQSNSQDKTLSLGLDSNQNNERIPNLNKEIVAQLVQKLGLEFTIEKQNNKGTFSPIDILDYIYAVLHSPNYREKYKEFLKIDFPRIPFPTDKQLFWKLVEIGSKIRQIHLLESNVVDKFITSYEIQGENEVEKSKFILHKNTQKETEKVGKVYINETQYFDSVPLISWEFFIGGYQPAQKWLKDRKGRKLSFEEINHYQKIIVALFETDKLMKQIDEAN